MKYIALLISVIVLFSCNTIDSKKKSIAIQPFGNVEQSLIDSLQTTIETVYNFESVYILKSKDLPEAAFINIKSPRYRADSIIKFLKQEKPDTLDFIMGITTKDISTTKRDNTGNVLIPKHKYEDWGIFGLGYRPGPTCLISTYRIKSANNRKFIDRIQKICMHEIGHNLGLKHCKVGEKCVMRDAAETIKTVDNVDLKLCATCQSIIE